MNNVIFVDVDYTVSPNRYSKRGGVTHYGGRHFIPDRLFIDLQALPGIKVWLATWGAEAEETFRCGWRLPTTGLEFDKLTTAILMAEELNATRVLWLDDEEAQELPGIPTLAIRPKRGLSMGDVARAAAWLRAPL